MLCRTSHMTNVDESWSTLAVALRNASKCVGGTLNMPCDLMNYHFINVNKRIWQCTISICFWLFYLFVLSNWPKEVISVRFVVSSFDTLIFITLFRWMFAFKHTFEISIPFNAVSSDLFEIFTKVFRMNDEHPCQVPYYFVKNCCIY